MAFNGSVTAAQSLDGLTLTIVDSSTGSDANLTDRRVNLNLYDGTTLVPTGTSTSYIDWPIGAGPLVLPILTRDYSISINVQWTSSSPLPSPSTYTFSVLQTFTQNLEIFDQGLTQMMAGNPLLVNDNGFFSNKELLRLYIDNAINTTSFNDQYNAQLNLNAAYKMQQNKTTLF
jgi:hypothetical protein